MKEFFGSLFALMWGITFGWTGFIFLTKEKFNKRDKNNFDDGFEYMISITPLPKVVNYWLIKILFILGSIFCIVMVIYKSILYFL